MIDNGLKYANKVEISLNKKNTNLFIIIDDDGPGIPKKEHENVFKPFYKMDKGRNDSKSSVGLGLSIASDIIKSHGGNIMLRKIKNFNGLRVKIFLSGLVFFFFLFLILKFYFLNFLLSLKESQIHPC